MRHTQDPMAKSREWIRRGKKSELRLRFDRLSLIRAVTMTPLQRYERLRDTAPGSGLSRHETISDILRDLPSRQFISRLVGVTASLFVWPGGRIVAKMSCLQVHGRPSDRSSNMQGLVLA